MVSGGNWLVKPNDSVSCNSTTEKCNEAQKRTNVYTTTIWNCHILPSPSPSPSPIVTQNCTLFTFLFDFMGMYVCVCLHYACQRRMWKPLHPTKKNTISLNLTRPNILLLLVVVYYFFVCPTLSLSLWQLNVLCSVFCAIIFLKKNTHWYKFLLPNRNLRRLHFHYV